MTRATERRWLFLLLAVVAWVYLPALSGNALDWDDPVWLADPVGPLAFSDACHLAFSTSRDNVYAPLLRLAFWALPTPFAQHAVSLSLFLLSIAGIHEILRRLRVPAVAALVAVALWALHPTKVECVAWITGLKDVLSLALLVAMTLSVCPADGAPSPRRIAGGTAFGVAGLLTKAAVFPVPFALALILAPQVGLREAARRIAPVSALAGALAWFGSTVWAPHPWPPIPEGALALWVHSEFVARLAPSVPAAITPIPVDPWPLVAGASSVAALAVVAAARWRSPLPALWLLPLLPFMGVVPMEFWASDRHLLIPSLAPALAVALAADRFEPSWAKSLPLALCLWFAPLSAARVPEWHDSLSLWQAEVTRPGEHWARWHKLGMALAIGGKFPAAVAAFDRSLSLNPGDRSTLARRLIASLAADGWTRSDGELVRVLEPAPATDTAWRSALDSLRARGELELAAYAQRQLGW